MTAENHILSRFAKSCVGVDIAADKTCGLRFYKLAAVLALADDFVRSGEVAYNGSACRSKVAGGRFGYPQILAYLGRKYKSLDIALKKELTYRRIVKVFNVSVNALARGKVTCFIKFAVIRDIYFRYKTEYPAALDSSGAVVKLSAERNGKSDKNEHIKVGGLLGNREKRQPCAFKQRFMQEKVAAGVARYAKLGENSGADVLFGSLSCKCDDLFCVMIAVCDFYIGCDGGASDKTVFHNILLLILQYKKC